MTSLALELESFFFAGLAASIALWIGWKRGFFAIPKKASPPENPPTLLLTSLLFFVYLVLGSIAPILFSSLFIHWIGGGNRVAILTCTTFMTTLTIAVSILLFCQMMPRAVRLTVFGRDRSFSLKNDFYIALYAWLISFPCTLFLGTGLELMLFLFTGTFELPDQIAVFFLKMTFDSPLYFSLAILTVVALAPLIEEICFRGFLQTYLRRYLSPTISLMLASLIFTLFHFSFSQGLGNIPILGSLFLLGCFLGFLYEKQGSLFAPIFLHALFNAVSVANLYFLGIE